MPFVNMGMMLGSCGTLGLGCWRLSESIEEVEEVENVTIERDTAILAPLGASAALLCAYFVGELFWAIILGYCVFGVMCIPFVLKPKFRNTFMTTTLACVIVGLWLITGMWIVHDIITVSIIVTSFCVIRVPSAKVYSLLLAGLVLYDVFWVFYSKQIFGEGVMVSVATAHRGHLNAPGTLIFPIGLGNHALLGAGDVIIPGLVVSTLYRYEACHARRNKELTVLAIIGFGLGMLMCNFMLDITRHSQPALLYVVPFTVLPTLLLAYKQGDLFPLWNGWEDTMYERL
eukprot:TRINITY_DN12144_c0_g1_i1.p1 TRINITY_DN12144_c0_g1~~TRINITY_DN12144_c0_g1_i1.p1  ORF type:complete len:287 (+),score=47.22 TRINITY_DN12144_c0_g1_i1:40-900(+)